MLALLFTAAICASFAAEPTAEDLLRQAQEARRRGRITEAISLAGQAINANPRSAIGYFARGQIYADTQDPTKAVADFSEAIQRDPTFAQFYHHRACEYFKLVHLQESLTDFDKAVQLAPQTEPHNWQRGIAQYYAGKYDEGRKQFELHQTVNANDVENAVWHYLCVARLKGIEQARKSLIEIKGDARVPMAQIHALFAGRGKSEDVLTAAQAGNPSAARLKDQLFYAHLYLGLYYEAARDDAKTREHIFKAAGEFAAPHYMGDVARVHARLLRQRAAAP